MQVSCLYEKFFTIAKSLADACIPAFISMDFHILVDDVRDFISELLFHYPRYCIIFPMGQFMVSIKILWLCQL